MEYKNRTQLMMSIEGNNKNNNSNYYYYTTTAKKKEDEVIEFDSLDLLIQREEELLLKQSPGAGFEVDNNDSFADDSFQKNTKVVPISEFSSSQRRRRRRKQNSDRISHNSVSTSSSNWCRSCSEQLSGNLAFPFARWEFVKEWRNFTIGFLNKQPS
jgi:hypothetical protein